MKRLITSLAAAAMLAVVVPARATEYGATVTITGLLHVVANRPVEPYSSTGFLRIYFAPTSAIGSGCSNQAADIPNTTANSRLLALVYLNRALGKPISLWVDNTLPYPNQDGTCQVVVVRDY